MKQHITVEQLNELSDEQQKNLQDWWVPADGDVIYISESLGKGATGVILNTSEYGFTIQGKDVFSALHDKACCLPLLSIGQLIELLSGDSTLFSFHRYDDCNGEQWNVRGTLYRRNDRFYETLKKDLCDALWEAIKKTR